MPAAFAHRRVLSRLGALMLGLAAYACSETSTLSTASPLAHARASPEALARDALDALSTGTRDRADSLRVTREEYETLIWPVLPDRYQMPFDFAWSITAPRSRKALRVAVEEYRGVPMELVRVELGEDVEAHDGVTLHRGSRMVVRRTDTGEEEVVPLMDTLVEMGGGWKFMNFADR